MLPSASADAPLTQFFKSDAAWNESRYKDPKFDALLLASRAKNRLLVRRASLAAGLNRTRKETP
ncbi:hypothetical protein CS8_054420 [Cupriavidus sp. 8B]